MKQGWIQVHNNGTQEPLAPKTMADMVYMDEVQGKTVKDILEELGNPLPPERGGTGISAANLAALANTLWINLSAGARIRAIQGYVMITAAANSYGSANVTFPSGYFRDDVGINVFATLEMNDPRTRSCGTTTNSNISGTVYLGNTSSAQVTTAVKWFALQIM